tara:strand:+ start:373 stop:780 length:408 start_codon:yes stop_codon:yes gene_type:complete
MDKKILIITSSYYEEISTNLLNGAQNFLKNKNLYNDVLNVPGTFEIPFALNVQKASYDGFIVLGCVIRGETYHFEIISNQVSRKIMDLSIEINKPIGFGILTCENIDQAMIRSNPAQGNKGSEAAKACVDLLKIQ